MGKNDTSGYVNSCKEIFPMWDGSPYTKLVILHTCTHQDDIEKFIPHEMRLSGVTGQTPKLN